jgi:hypothetical protein
MPDVELTQDYFGGRARAGDCGHIASENQNGTVNIVLTRRDCQPLSPNIPIPLVPREHLRPCHCAE